MWLFVRGLFCVACLGLFGCGFQLRTYSFEGSVDTFAITGLNRAQVVAPLRRNLRQLGIEESGKSEAALIVEILDQRSDRRSVSTSGRARAAEYEIEYGVQYQILNGSGTVLAVPLWIERQRVYRIDRGNIVGSSEEQALVQQELMQDVAGQIIRAMDLVSRSAED